jgi:hypothetical protein
MSRMRKYWVLLLLLTATAALASEAEMLAVDSTFASGQYEQVELLVLRLLQGNPPPKADETARLCLTAGYALIMLGRETPARDYFARALDAVPDLTLDPVLVSPKFRMVFDDVKASRQLNLAQEKIRPEEKLLRANRQSLLSNLIVPGSGQLQEGYPLRGALLFVAQAAAVGALLWSVDDMQDRQGEYLAESDPARMQAKYDSYDRAYQTVWIAGVATGVIYLAAQADLIRIKPRLRADKPQANLYMPLKMNGIGVAIRW